MLLEHAIATRLTFFINMYANNLVEQFRHPLPPPHSFRRVIAYRAFQVFRVVQASQVRVSEGHVVIRRWPQKGRSLPYTGIRLCSHRHCTRSRSN